MGKKTIGITLLSLAALILPAHAETITIGDIPTVLPRNTPLVGYSPYISFSYGGLKPERYTARLYLLETTTGNYYCASGQRCGEPPFQIDNRTGSNSTGTILNAQPMDVHDYASFLWVVDLYNQAGVKVASATKAATATRNRAPVLSFVGNKVGTIGRPFEFDVAATDPDGDPITLRVENLPSGATFDPVGWKVRWPAPILETFQNIVIRATQSGPEPLGDAEIISVRIISDAPDIVGQWGAPLLWPAVPIHMSLLPTGTVLFWDRHNTTLGWDGVPYVWDMMTGKFSNPLPPTGWDLFCSGHTFLADGRLLVTGGHIEDFVGEPQAGVYDPVTNSWTRVSDMNAGRWYPTNVLLPNGEALTLAGTIRANEVNSLPQVWQPATNTWRNLTSARLGAYPAWPDYYPFLYVAPNGRVFNAGPQQTARYLDTTGLGLWIDVARSTLLYRDYGSSVMYDDGKVLIVGGNPRDTAEAPSILPSPTAEVIDLNATMPTWRVIAPMFLGRRHLNATLLPDGKVLVTGGSSAPGFDSPVGAARNAELWDPASETWSTLAAGTRYKGYHSNALLLPDGRVLVTDGGHPDPLGLSGPRYGELYAPPYLFQGARPITTAVPAPVRYGQRFAITTPDVADIQKVTWIRLPSATHGFVQNQRFNRLIIVGREAPETLRVEAPTNPNLCPPGDYMLFILNGRGTPSQARFVRLVGN